VLAAWKRLPPGVARETECNKVFFRVVAGVTAKLFVVESHRLPKKCLALLSEQEFEESRRRIEQGFRIPVVPVNSRQEVRADHLQAVCA